jgi:hypothetical protein
MFRSSMPPRPSAFFAVRKEEGWVRVVRSAQRFEDEQQLRVERQNVGLQLDAIGRGKALLIDSRLAPASTDFELGAEFKALRREVERGFERVAILVKTKVGVLQANRLKDEDASRFMRVFDEERDAIAFLVGT